MCEQNKDLENDGVTPTPLERWHQLIQVPLPKLISTKEAGKFSQDAQGIPVFEVSFSDDRNVMAYFDNWLNAVKELDEDTPEDYGTVGEMVERFIEAGYLIDKAPFEKIWNNPITSMSPPGPMTNTEDGKLEIEMVVEFSGGIGTCGEALNEFAQKCLDQIPKKGEEK